MKATLEIPNDLYRQVKAKSAMQGRPVREVTMELYQKWLTSEEPSPNTLKKTGKTTWIKDWVTTGKASCQNLPKGASARELLNQERSRLVST